ncbi:cadherin-like domain-containing protein [Azohydromonas lata]|uniref:Cadherin-like domain-containing protein n=1 Tax=Azohydromonas lata TaxID=45677 RepID=A0ABU5IPX0_9BURK|nr:cadherin-like domain-containing protein [Azohydromonas lata]MDZ5460922.1 cadherin-like domain-containing protein [Azohydromonas lata]
MALNTTSFSNTPQAKDDAFAYTEDQLLASGQMRGDTTISLDVMANDLGGQAKTLFSIDDGSGNLLNDLLASNITTGWETTANGNEMRICNGKVEINLKHALDSKGTDSINGLKSGETVTDSFVYSIRLANGTLSWAKVSVNVTGSNDGPERSATVAQAIMVQGTEDTGYTIKAADLLQGFTDADHDTLSVANLTAAHGTLTNNGNGTWTFTPYANYNGPVSLSYDVVDGHGGSIAATQSFNVAAINDAPTGSASATLAAGTEDTGYTIKAADLLQGFSDVDGDDLSIANLTATNGTLTDNGDGTWSFAPSANFNGTVALAYDVVDGHGGTVAATQSLNVAAVNDAPTGSAAAALAAGTEDTGYTIKAADLLQGFSDVDGDTLSVANLTATNGTLTDNGDGTWSFAPSANFNGTVALAYDVVDGHGGTVGATQSFSLAAVNDAPTGSASAVLAAGTEDTGYTIKAADLLQGFSDVDGDTLAVANLTASNGTLTDNGDGTWSFAPSANFNGTVALAYDVADSHGGTVAATQSFNVAAVNDAPTGSASAALAAGTEDNGYTIKAADLLQGFSDVDGDDLSVANLTATNGTLADNGDGTWSFAPSANFNGTVALAYDVVDGHGGTVAATQSLNVAAVNDAPTGSASAVLAAGTEDNAYTITATSLLQGFTDVDGDTLAVANLTATNGTLANNGNGSWTFSPAANYNGTVQLSYSVTDGHGGSAAATQSFSLAAVNDAPTGSASAALAAGTEDNAYTISATSLLQGFSDVDGDTLAVANLTATNGTLANNGDGSWTFSPAANYNGTVQLSYSVTDGHGGSAAAAQSFNIAAVNDAPDIRLTGLDSASKTLKETDAGLSTSGTLSINDVDTADTVASTVTGVTTSGTTAGLGQNTNQLLSMFSVSPGSGLAADSTNTSNLAWTFNSGSQAFNYLAAGQSLTLTYTINANDGHGGSDTQQVAITINGTTETPAVYTGTGDSSDTVTGSAGTNVYVGTAGNDTINVNGNSNSNDTIYGYAGNDNLDGGAGADVIYGGPGNDILAGGNGIDRLFGGSGNDTITGDGQDDSIVGGFGADLLTGGNGLDKFVYLDTRDTGDTITDFKSGEGDVIDFSAIDAIPQGSLGNDAFAWGGNTETLLAHGVTWFQDSAANRTVVQLDTDGDVNTAELQLQLTGQITLNKVDFVL